LRPDLIMQMAPVIATMMAGGLANSLKSQGFSNILGQLGGAISSGGGSPASAGGLAGLFSSFMGMFSAMTGSQATSGGAPSGQAALDALRRTLQPGQVDPQHQAAIGDILKR
jgi:hypothetical protein